MPFLNNFLYKEKNGFIIFSGHYRSYEPIENGTLITKLPVYPLNIKNYVVPIGYSTERGLATQTAILNINLYGEVKIYCIPDDYECKYIYIELIMDSDEFVEPIFNT